VLGFCDYKTGQIATRRRTVPALLTPSNPSPRQVENFPYHQLASKASLIIATMVSKFMANAAFKARLSLRPSHQHTILFGTLNRLECPAFGRPMLPPILSSRSYSNSTSTLPFPKPSRPTAGSQSSGPKDKNWFHSKGWAKDGAVMVTVSLVRAGSFLCTIWNILITKGSHIRHPRNLGGLVPDISETCTRICTRICNL